MSEDTTNEIWLEVMSVRIQDDKISVQVRGDKRDREPEWWPLAASLTKRSSPVSGNVSNEKLTTACLEHDRSNELHQAIQDGLDKKRTVLVKLACKKGNDHHLHVTSYRIQSADSIGR